MRFLCLLIGIVSFSAWSNEVKVIGNCSIKVTPDQASVVFTAENQSKDQKSAALKTNSQMNSLKEKIKSLNLEDVVLKNTNYQVQPIREYEKDRLIDKGTRVALSLEVTTSSITRLNEAMDLAIKEGIQNVSSLRMFLSQKKNQAEYSRCLEIASEEANSKAKLLAKKFNQSLGEAVKIQETGASAPGPVFHERAMMKSADSSPLETGEQDFQASVEVTFELK